MHNLKIQIWVGCHFFQERLPYSALHYTSYSFISSANFLASVTGFFSGHNFYCWQNSTTVVMINAWIHSICFILLDDICGALPEHAHTIVDGKSCGIPLMNNFPQVLINNSFVDILSSLVLTNCVLYNKEGYCGIKSCVTRTITQ